MAGSGAGRQRDPLGPLLAVDPVVVIDGGLATELEEAGHSLADGLWSALLLADEPEAIVAAHLAYFRAGARVAISASYQATFEAFAARGIAHAEAAALVARSVALADEARRRYRIERAPADPGPLLVAASVGPYGAYLADGAEYRGRYGISRAALRDFHRERLRLLWDAGPDLLACETIPDLDEVDVLAGLVDEAGAPAWLALSCADGGHLRDGARVEDAAAIAEATPGFVAVGVNCTTPEHVGELVARIATATAKPIVVYPNSGEGWEPGTGRWLPATGPNVDVASARDWVAAGARIVGGCCRVGPARIAELARAFESSTGRPPPGSDRSSCGISPRPIACPAPGVPGRPGRFPGAAAASSRSSCRGPGLPPPPRRSQWGSSRSHGSWHDPGAPIPFEVAEPVRAGGVLGALGIATSGTLILPQPGARCSGSARRASST